MTLIVASTTAYHILHDAVAAYRQRDLHRLEEVAARASEYAASMDAARRRARNYYRHSNILAFKDAADAAHIIRDRAEELFSALKGEEGYER